MAKGASKGNGRSGGGKVQNVDLKTANATAIDKAINQAQSVDALNVIIETIADNDVISNNEYTNLYSKALTKAQNWQPTATATSQSKSNTTQTTKVTRATTGDIQNIYRMPIGTVVTARTSYGQYIGELTKVSAKKWVGSQKRKSLYPAPNDVSSIKAMDFEIGNMNLTIKSK